jgi:hypothetical protein
MKTIKSKISIRRVLKWVVLTYTFALGIWACWFVIPRFNFDIMPPYVMLFIGLSFIGLAIWGFVWDQKNAHTLILDEEKIFIGRLGTFYWRDFESVDLNETKRYGNKILKIILIRTKTGRTINLFNAEYANIDEIRDHLQTYFVDRRG